MSRETVEDAPEDRGSRRPIPIDVHVGSRVRLRRMLLGMSQEKLGEQLGLTFQQIQKYEKGINRIGASRLFDLAHVLGVPVQFFYEERAGGRRRAAPRASPSRPAEKLSSSTSCEREGLELNKAFVRITDPQGAPLDRRARARLAGESAQASRTLEAPSCGCADPAFR